MIIRNATNQDQETIDRIYVAAFPEREGEIVAKIARDLFAENTNPEVISLVAEIEGNAVGHVAFSPVYIENHPDCLAYILTPLAVKPQYQKRRIGSALVEYGIKKLSEMNVTVVFVYGDPKYYGRFGFAADVAQAFKVPYKLQYPYGWLGVFLKFYEIEKAPVAIRFVPTLCDPTIW